MGRSDFKPGTERVEDFFYWINERHRIYLRKQAGDPRPWTEDPILDEFKFTNAFRQLDRGTVFYTERIRAELDGPELLMNTVIYRMVNNVATFEECGLWEGDGTEFKKRMRARRERGDKVFTSAHMTVGVGGEDKLETNIRSWEKLFADLDEFYDDMDGCNGSLQEAFHEILAWKIFGVGKFIAYEIVCDLRWWLWFPVTDSLTWANPGPGASRGLRRLGFTTSRSVTSEECNVAMRRLWEQAETSLAPWVRPHHPTVRAERIARSKNNLDPCVLPHVEQPPFEMREIEHSLCEFDKYCRAKRGQGAPRERYRPCES